MPAPDIATCYDLETPLEAAFKALLVSASLTAYATADAFVMKKSRPRVELQLTVGDAVNHYATVGGTQRNDGWRCQLALGIATDSAQNTSHASYRAACRAAIAGAVSAINATLDYHEVRWLSDAGTTPAINKEDGTQISTLIYSVHAFVKPEAWPV